MIRHEPGSVDAALGADRLFAAAPEALFVLRGNDIALANESGAELVGRDPSGSSAADLVSGWSDHAGTEDPFEATFTKADGSSLPVEVRVRPLEDGTAIVAIRDARQLIAGRDAAVALTEAEARYRSLVEQIPAVVYADDGTVTTYVSPQIEQILGVTPEAYRADKDLWLVDGPSRRPRDRGGAEQRVHPGRGWRHRRLPDGSARRTRRCGSATARTRSATTTAGCLWEHGLLFDVTELKEAEARVAHLAYHDSLTGLANRELFEETLGLAVERAKRSHSNVAVIFFDLDNFKLVNDSLGHHAGDLLLVELAERLRACTRDTDLVARQGGDEFLMLLSDLDLDTADETIRLVAARIEEAMHDPFDLQGTEFHARGSSGISVYPRDAHDPGGLMRNADIAMYRAKRLEPGGHVFFAADGDDALERLSFSTRLRQAVENENWVLHYQPVVDLADRRVIGAEALIRWKDATGGIVAPGEFIPLAEELGLIEAIGDWVVEAVARQQREWRDNGLELEVSFNLSPRQLWTPRLAERLIGLLHDAGVDPGTLTAEITESTAMADPDRTHRVLRDLHAWGLRLAIDDFGTGYSSLSRLKHMPVDVLKIDREFIRDVDRDVRLAGMVRAMIQVAQSLDMIPLAEGVETEGEYVFLRSNGCRLAQGFWFAHPVPAADLAELVAREGGLGATPELR